MDLTQATNRSALRDRLQSDLLDRIVPFWIRHGVDSRHGGLLTSLDRRGEVLDTDKSIWAQGRFAWLTGELIRQFGDKPAWRAAGCGTLDFLDRFGFDPADGRMWFQVTRRGQPIRKRRYSFAESFAALGYASLAVVTGNRSWRKRAVQCFETFRDSPAASTAAKYTPTRRVRSIGQPMIALGVARQLQQLIDYPQAGMVIDQALEQIENDFCRPDLQCVLENTAAPSADLDHFDLRTLNPGHAIEAAWFVMREGQWQNRIELVERGCRMLDWMWKRGWDAQYGGIFCCVSVDDRPIQEYWHEMKFWWPHNEAIIATLLAWVLTGDSIWAKRFATVWHWSLDRFPDPQGEEWFGYLNRDGTVNSTLKGNLWKGAFHVPRMYLECLRILDEFTARQPVLPVRAPGDGR